MRVSNLGFGASSLGVGEDVQMLPPFMADGRNTAEVFLSNMDSSVARATPSPQTSAPSSTIWSVAPVPSTSSSAAR